MENIVQQRIDELTSMKERLSVTQAEDGQWNWFLDKEIHELTCGEIENARLARRTLGKRTWLKSLLLLILSSPESKRKGESV
ncbi:hypothetical protein [Paenibacillus sp. 276b]|uniref:hypothetical protein n=1 Tax=Paenibacillus sp. 276b TaxID=1566277 RepID=UPI0008961B4D|nr:hypothetical protein [Paenibacillus sp. 276b]SEB28061.1 hypothetical protein SAMN03159332_0146 [Paenibacillus sp. 276b]